MRLIRTDRRMFLRLKIAFTARPRKLSLTDGASVQSFQSFQVYLELIPFLCLTFGRIRSIGI
jgi:hypothetical protein